MIFSSLEFIIFFLAILAGLWAIGSRNTARKSLLLLASYYFYAYWDCRLLSLIIISTLTDYCIGKSLGTTSGRRVRKVLL